MDSPPKKGTCPECEQEIYIRESDGMLVWHFWHDLDCDGSGQPPKSAEEVKRQVDGLMTSKAWDEETRGALNEDISSVAERLAQGLSSQKDGEDNVRGR